MNRKNISLIGIIVGIAFVVVGVLAMAGVLGGDTSYPSSAPSNFNSGYASFNGDYYTYSVNNSAETATAARTTAGNLGDIADFLKIFCGLFSIGFGFVVACGFGIVYVDCVEKEKAEAPITEEEIEEILAIAEENFENEETFSEDENTVQEEIIPATDEISEDTEEKQE